MGLQAGLTGDPAQIGLLQSTDGEQRGRQLRLAELVQEIALVLAAVYPAQQAPATAHLVHARVVAGGDFLGAQVTGCVEEMLELHFAVAQHVRIRRAARGIFGQKVFEHPLPVLRREIAEMEGDAQAAADGHRIATVVLGTALAGAVVGPVLHEEPGDGFSLLDKLQGGHR